jgi:hypothetical protein
MKMQHLLFALLATNALTGYAKDLSADIEPLNTFGIRYESSVLPEGVSRAASWRQMPVQLSNRNQEQTIHLADAAFVKVYFDYVDLQGYALEVTNPDGSERYVYSDQQSSDRTVDETIGQDGKSSFASMSITGDTAIVRLLPTAPSEKSERAFVAISHVLEGYPEGVISEYANTGLFDGGNEASNNRSICGADDKRPVACYTGTQANRATAVGRLVLGSGGSCTAWRVSSSNRMMTNNHCFSTTAGVTGSEVWFNYQTTTCAGTTTATVTKVSGASLLKTSSALDYSLFTVNNFASISSFGYLGLDVRVPTSGEQIYIPQHPGGRRKELAIASGSDSGSVCRISTASSGVNSLYSCDTEPGSSGSPVLASSSNKVINLHHLGGCGNAGVRISRIWPEISSFFSAVP